MSQQLTKELFLSGTKFKCPNLGKIYSFVPSGGKYMAGRIDVAAFGANYVEAIVASIAETGFSGYSTICGTVVDLEWQYSNFEIVVEKEVANV